MTPDEEYRHWVSTHNVIVSGGAPKTVCPLCTDTHVICVFQAGTLNCVGKDCANPHHSPPMLGPQQS